MAEIQFGLMKARARRVRQAVPEGVPGAARGVRHAIARGGDPRVRAVFGSPDEVAEAILSLHRATGINHLIMSAQWPGMPQTLVLDELHMLAEEVFPKARRGQ